MKRSTLAAACTAAALLGLAASTAAAPTLSACKARSNDTPDKVVECIQQQALWQHMIAFQSIADQNPGPDGHPSRNSGEPGYKASVDYVAAEMRAAGYQVQVQRYTIPYFAIEGTPQFAEQSPSPRNFTITRDWYVAYYTGAGNVSAPLQPVAGITIPSTGGSSSGCKASDFGGFVPGNVALVQRGGCGVDTKVANATSAGASAIVIFNEGNSPERLAPPDFYLSRVAKIPVVVTSYVVGADLYRECLGDTPPTVAVNVSTVFDPYRADYNLIADSPYGDPNHVVIAEGHLDAIFGAGMLDNASGSASILEIALTLAKTPTRNQMRYIWFGGEELGLLGSAYYAESLSPAELGRIVFDIDADVTASPNYDFLIANPAYASNARSFPANVIPESVIGNQLLEEFYASQHLFALDGPRAGGNNGTDSNSLSLVGVPNTGVFTGQDCCKSQAGVDIWGGYPGNHEGRIPSFDGGCVDYIGRWCDDLDNADPTVLETVSKSLAFVTLQLANHAFTAGARAVSAAAPATISPRQPPARRGGLVAE